MKKGISIFKKIMKAVDYFGSPVTFNIDGKATY